MHIGAKWYAKGDFIQECSKQVHISLVYGYEVSNSLGGHSEPPWGHSEGPKAIERPFEVIFTVKLHFFSAILTPGKCREGLENNFRWIFRSKTPCQIFFRACTRVHGYFFPPQSWWFWPFFDRSARYLNVDQLGSNLKSCIIRVATTTVKSIFVGLTTW